MAILFSEQSLNFSGQLLEKVVEIEYPLDTVTANLIGYRCL